jgi:hypothetical protein
VIQQAERQGEVEMEDLEVLKVKDQRMLQMQVQLEPKWIDVKFKAVKLLGAKRQ